MDAAQVGVIVGLHRAYAGQLAHFRHAADVRQVSLLQGLQLGRLTRRPGGAFA